MDTTDRNFNRVVLHVTLFLSKEIFGCQFRRRSNRANSQPLHFLHKGIESMRRNDLSKVGWICVVQFPSSQPIK